MSLLRSSFMRPRAESGPRSAASPKPSQASTLKEPADIRDKQASVNGSEQQHGVCSPRKSLHLSPRQSAMLLQKMTGLY